VAQSLTCTRCGAGFDCDPGGDCWCMHLDVRLPMPVAQQDCICADCLRAAAREARSAGAVRESATQKGAK
jgi:hypothetical protein